MRLIVEPLPSLCQDEFMLILKRTVNVYETDLMGIVHHSNYLRFCEEARVKWCVERGLLNASKEAVFSLTVTETRVQHKSPMRYGDLFEIHMQAQTKGARLTFQYQIKVGNQICGLAETVHCALDEKFKVIRLKPDLVEKVKESPWIETWL